MTNPTHRGWRYVGALGIALMVALMLRPPRPAAQAAFSASPSLDDAAGSAPAHLNATLVVPLQAGRPVGAHGNVREAAAAKRFHYPRGDAAHLADAAAAEYGPASPADAVLTPSAAPAGKPGASVSYDGLNIVNNATANQYTTGYTNVTPPDNATCVNGPGGYSVQLVNLVAGSFDNTRGKAGPQMDLNDFFSSSAAHENSLMFDPRCFYDQAADVWYFIATSDTHFDVEVVYDNGASDAGSFWSLPYAVWRVDTTALGVFEDNPALAATDEIVYVTGNAFRTSDGSFRGSDIWMISRSDLLATAPAPATLLWGHWSGLADDACGTTPTYFPISALRPAQAPMPDASQPGEILLSSFDPRGCGGVFSWAFAITNESAVNTCPYPVNGFSALCPRLVTTGASYYNGQPYQTFYNPPLAIQKSSAYKLDGDDDRFWQVNMRQGVVYGSLSTAVLISGDTANRSGVAWWMYQPTWAIDSSGYYLSAIPTLQQGIFGVLGSYLLYPAMAAADGTGHMAMMMSLSGSSYYPSAVAANAPFGTTSLTTLGAGFTAYADTFSCPSGACRFGDYSSALTVPGSRTVWGSAEYVSNQKYNVTNWATRIVSVTP